MKVPKYVADMVRWKRIAPAPISEQQEDAWGYAFRVYRYSNGQWDRKFEAEVLRLVKWAKREYADRDMLKHQCFDGCGSVGWLCAK